MPTPTGIALSKSSPDILKWIFVVFMVVAIAGLGYLYLKEVTTQQERIPVEVKEGSEATIIYPRAEDFNPPLIPMWKCLYQNCFWSSGLSVLRTEARVTVTDPATGAVYVLGGDDVFYPERADGVSQELTEDRCGNGVLEIFEQCDDGNQTNGDGCDRSCSLEPTRELCQSGKLICSID